MTTPQPNEAQRKAAEEINELCLTVTFMHREKFLGEVAAILARHFPSQPTADGQLVDALTACDRAFASWQVGQIPGRPEDILALIKQVRDALNSAPAPAAVPAAPQDAKLATEPATLVEALKVAEIWLSNCVPIGDIPGPKPLPLIRAALQHDRPPAAPDTTLRENKPVRSNSEWKAYTRLEKDVDELAMFICRLVRALGKDHATSKAAMEYLTENDLLGSPMRKIIAEPAANKTDATKTKGEDGR